MTILLTGAAGFIGSHITDRLLANGHNVIGLDNFDPFYDRRMKDQNLEEARKNPCFHFIEGDIRDKELLERIFSSHRIDSVIHLAAKAGVRPSMESPLEYADVNINGTLTVLEAMRNAGVRKMLFASSSSVYGNQEKLPFSESDPVDKPISPYAATKRAGELLCHAYHVAHQFDIWCLRFFTVYGPRQRPEMAIAKFLSAARNGKTVTVFGDGSMQRDFTYISDIVNGVVTALYHVHGYEIINIGGSHAYTLNALVEEIQRAAQSPLSIAYAPIPPGDVMQTYADTTKAKRLIDFSAHVPLAEGLAKQWTYLSKSESRDV